MNSFCLCQFFSLFFRVANTDNTSIIGITIDYGPFGFLDYYDPNYISQSYGTGLVIIQLYRKCSAFFLDQRKCIAISIFGL